MANSTWNIYNFRLNVIDKLLVEGHKVIVIAPIDEFIEYKEKYPSVRHIGLRTMDRDSTNPLKDLLLTAELTRKYRKLKPDLIIHYTNKPNIYGGVAAYFAGCDSIAMITGLGYAFIHNGFIKKITTAMYRWTSRFHRKFIFENVEDRELFTELKIIDSSKGISIKGCGVNTSFFRPSPNGVLKEKIIFTFIGRLLYDKGIREFVEAARIVRPLYTNVEFWIVGELDPENPATVDKDDLIKWVENDTVVYHGFLRDVRPIISDSDCIILPSYREAIPRTITEGMAMGKAVITTDTAGCREAVDEGENGFLVEVGSIPSLVNAIKNFVALDADQRHLMGVKGRQKVMNEFDDRSIANQIYSIIDESFND